MQGSRNIAARAGRWSARHRKLAIFGWLAFVFVALALNSMTGTKTLDDSQTGVGDSGHADKALARAIPSSSADESVLVQSKSIKASDPAFKSVVSDVKSRISRVAHVQHVKAGPVSRDGHSRLVNFEVAGDDDQVLTRVGATEGAVAAAQRAHPKIRVAQFGDASATKAITDSQNGDFSKAEVTSLPLTLLILLLAFGAIVAAGVPVLLAISAVAITIGLLGPISQVIPTDGSVGSVVLLIGLAVGVDYALFYIRREREERAAGHSEEAALEAAAATSGRAILISGFTVMIAMAGMYLAGAQTFSSFATGTILVVGVAMLASVSVLPALLSVLGDRINKGRLPFIGRRRSGESRIWSAILDRVLRRPLAAALLAGALLVALAVPAFSMKTELPGLDSFSRNLPVMRTYDRIQAAFPGKEIPADVVVEARDVTSPRVKAAIGELEHQALQSKHLRGPAELTVSKDHSLAQVSIPIAGDGTNGQSKAALTELRDDVVPTTVGKLDGVQANVSGITAGTEDFNHAMKSHLPYVFAFVLAAAFMLLLVTFRSIVIPLKAIVLNLLSVGAAYGILVAVFQWGWGENLLNFNSTGGIAAWLPMFLFVILFGLSMDYHVFILSRVREAFDRGMTTEEAVGHGVKTTAGVVTSAALVMVGVFSIFATLSGIEMKQLGVGLAAAILIDATVIRGVLLPATMKLLGDWNWWLPKRLHWIPKVTHEHELEPARA
jgi:uncharacterized membrane protein YdfJ with MMPL/SSD domain